MDGRATTGTLDELLHRIDELRQKIQRLQAASGQLTMEHAQSISEQIDVLTSVVRMLIEP